MSVGCVDIFLKVDSPEKFVTIGHHNTNLSFTGVKEFVYHCDKTF
jgi:hypothetical protein